MKRLFGTDGIRGTPGKSPLTKEEIRLIGQSFSTFLGKSPRLIVCRDTRESGKWMQESLVSGLTDAGAHVTQTGILNTPAAAYLSKAQGMDGAMIISASHNPAEENGIKFFTGQGRKLNEKQEEDIERIYLSKSVNTGKGTAIEDPSMAERYVDFVTGLHTGLERLKAVIDCANGAAYITAPRILKRLGMPAIVMNAEPDGTNINKECGSEHPGNLCEQVIKNKADMGIALDGDADRAVIVDEKGNVLTGDQVIGIAAIHLKHSRQLANNKVVVTHYSSYGLEETMRKHCIAVIRTDVGDQKVAAEMARQGASLGGEQSGHVIFSELSTTGDGLITALQIATLMQQENKPLSRLAAQIMMVPQAVVNVEVREKKPLQGLKAMEIARQAENELGSEGRVFLRYSGTQNLLRILVEGKNEKQINDLAQEISRHARKELQP